MMFVNYFFDARVLVGIIVITLMIGLICNENNAGRKPYSSAKTLRPMYSSKLPQNGRPGVCNGLFPRTGSAHVMIITHFPTCLPPNWPHQLQTPSCGPVMMYKLATHGMCKITGCQTVKRSSEIYYIVLR